MPKFKEFLPLLGGIAATALTGGAAAPLAMKAGLDLYSARRAERKGREAREHEEAVQREFAQHGVQWRVEDAKRAGLHPLFALGASTPGYSPAQAVMDPVSAAVSNMGQDVSRAVTAGSTSPQKEMTALQLEAARAAINKDYAITSYYDSMAMRNFQHDNESVGLGSGPGVPQSSQFSAENVGRVKVTPNPVVSAAAADLPNQSAGVKPGWDLVAMGPGTGGLRMLLPQTNEGLTESWFELGLLEKFVVYNYNIRHNPDPNFASKFWREFYNNEFMARATDVDLERARQEKARSYVERRLSGRSSLFDNPWR